MKKTPSVGKDIATKLSYTVNKMINWWNRSEKLFYKIIAEHTTPLCPSGSILMYIPKEMHCILISISLGPVASFQLLHSFVKETVNY